MNTDEKLNYMIGCLQVAKEEMDHMAEHHMVETESRDSMEEREKYWKYIERTGNPNKSLVTDNLRNVARMAFKLAREIDHER